MKIYDCFTFYNELDLLEVRLAELYNHVDCFVIVESSHTFTNRAKPYLYEQNQDRFAQWADKIRHIKHVSSCYTDAWHNETDQRDAIMRGLTDAAPTDVAIISDVDEIIRPQAVDFMRVHPAEIYGLRMPLYNFKFNYMRVNPGRYDTWAMACQVAHLNSSITPNTLRNQRFNFNGMPLQYAADGVEVIEHAGWHFGYLGDNEYLRDKAQSFSHQEVNHPAFLNQIDVDASIAEGKEWDRSQSNSYQVVELDDYFPSTVVNNQPKYSKFILDNTTTKALDLLPSYPYNN
jgi:Glycosyltransferase family 17